MADGRDYFRASIDTSQLDRDASHIRRTFSGISQAAEIEGSSIEASFNKAGVAIAGIFTFQKASEFIRDITSVRGEFQQLEIAFETMLGSKSKADALMNQMVDTAARTPFDLTGVANGAKQLLAYGTASEEVNETLIRLGNIASGLSIPLNDLVYLYGTTQVQGRLFTNDLNQFLGRGIPIIKELAKELGVAETDIRGLVSAGKIGFPEVQKVIENLTNEGGMFFNLMEKQSSSITGQIANLEDAWDVMLNSIGAKTDSAFTSAIDITTSLVENYEMVGKVLGTIVVSYGTYKAAVIALNLVQKQQAAINAIVASSNGVFSRSLALQWLWTERVQKAQALLNKTMLTNPYVLAAMGVVALGYGIYKLVTYQTDAEKAQSRLNDAIKESEKASLGETRELARLKGELSAATKGTDEYNTVKEKIVKNYSKYYKGLDKEIEKVGLLESTYNKLTEAIQKSFGARQYEAFIQSEQDNLDSLMSENLGKIQDRLIEKLGDEAGTKYYAKIRNAIIEGTVNASDNFYGVTGLDKETQSALDKVSGKSTNDLFKNHAIEGYIRNIITAKKLTDEIDKKARVKFGIEDIDQYGVDATTSETKKVKTLTEQTDEARKAVSALKLELANLRSGKTKSDNYAKDIEEKTKELKTAEDKLSFILTGKTSSTSSNSTSDTRINKARELQNLQAELDSETIKQQLEHEQKLLDIEQDSFDKRYRQNQLNAAKEFVSVEEYRQKMAKAQQDAAKDIYISKTGSEKGFDFSSFDKTLLPEGLKDSDVERQVEGMMDIILATYRKENEVLAKEQKAFADEESLTFASQLDQQIYSIRAHYTERKQLASGNAELLKQISENENREIIAARLQAHQRQLESDAAYNQKVVEIINDRYAFESDRQKAAIEQQIRDQKKIFNDLEKQVLNDPNNDELSNQLREAYIQLRLLNKELEKTKIGKLKEIANDAADISSSLRDALGDFGAEFSDDVNKALDGFEQVLTGASQLAEGLEEKNPAKIIKGVIDQTRGYFNLFSGILGTADYSGYEKLKSKYDNLLDIWDELIAKKKAYLSESVADEVVRVEKEALDLINKQADAVRKLGEARLKSGSSAGSHSLWYRMWKGSYKFDGKNWRNVAGDIEKELGVSFTKMEDLLYMSAEQLEWIKGNYSGLWAVMDDDFRGYLEQLITYGDDAQEIIDQAKESLTGVSFDNMKDSFLNTLLDMSSDAEDFTDDFVSYFQKAIMQRMLDNQFSDRLQSFYDSFAEANKENGIDSSEYSKLQSEWNNIVNDALAERDKLKDIFDWSDDSSTSQQSSKGGYESMSQDTALALEGRFAALQMTGISIDTTIKSLFAVESESLEFIKSFGGTFQEMRNIGLKTMSHLENIEKYTKYLPVIANDIEQVKQNTSRI